MRAMRRALSSGADAPASARASGVTAEKTASSSLPKPMRRPQMRVFVYPNNGNLFTTTSSSSAIQTEKTCPILPTQAHWLIVTLKPPPRFDNQTKAALLLEKNIYSMWC